jgi:hypothetical protein
MFSKSRIAIVCAAVVCAVFAAASVATGNIAPAAAATVVAAAVGSAVMLRNGVHAARFVPAATFGAAVVTSVIFAGLWAALPAVLGGVAVAVFTIWARFFGPAPQLPPAVRSVLSSSLTLADDTAAGVHLGATDMGAVVMAVHAAVEGPDFERARAFKSSIARIATARQILERQHMSAALAVVIVDGDLRPVEVGDVTVCSVAHVARLISDRTRQAGPAIDLDEVDLKEMGVPRAAARQLTRHNSKRKSGPRVEHRGRVTKVTK